MDGTFSTSGTKRAPNADEQANGFACGPADQALFNWLSHATGQEINNVISFAGLTPSNGDLAQLRKSIESLIAAATGGGDTSQFLLVSQAASRLPIFPEFVTADGSINLTSPASGTVRIPSGIDFLHRGASLYTTAQTDLSTIANKTYHVRWNATDGFTINDLSDVTYNPSSLSEDDASFDSTFDDMLVARVVTNSSNVATIANLKNTNRLVSTSDFDLALANAKNAWATLAGTAVTLNWARTPVVKSLTLTGVQSFNGSLTTAFSGNVGTIAKLAARNGVVNRYFAADFEYVYDDDAADGSDNGRGAFNRLFMAA